MKNSKIPNSKCLENNYPSLEEFRIKVTFDEKNIFSNRNLKNGRKIKNEIFMNFVNRRKLVFSRQI